MGASASADSGYQGQSGERLIILGQDGIDLDACGGYGEVYRLKRGGDGYLSVRIAPGSRSKERDRIANGNQLWLCDKSGEWYGVVYQKPGDPELDCGVSSPIGFISAYRGPCRFGWVHESFVNFLAG